MCDITKKEVRRYILPLFEFSDTSSANSTSHKT
nr:MAG TPA: hypothetical protein [Caudoviricetes sp.]